jgi:hypothetical protein
MLKHCPIESCLSLQDLQEKRERTRAAKKSFKEEAAKLNAKVQARRLERVGRPPHGPLGPLPAPRADEPGDGPDAAPRPPALPVQLDPADLGSFSLEQFVALLPPGFRGSVDAKVKKRWRCTAVGLGVRVPISRAWGYWTQRGAAYQLARDAWELYVEKTGDGPPPDWLHDA